jgi:hypothetical protein
MSWRSPLAVRPHAVLVAGVARTDLACAVPGRTPSLGVQAPSDIDCQRQPAADAIAIELAPPARCAVALDAHQGPRPPRPRLDSRGRKRARPSWRSGTTGEATASRSTTPMKVHRPRSRNQWLPLPALRRYAPSVAFGLKLRVLAAGPAHVLTVLPLKRLCERPANLIVGARKVHPDGDDQSLSCRLT